MSRSAVVGLVLVTGLLLQTTLFPHVAIAGYRPDLLVMVTAAFALADGPVTGMRVGFGAGVLSDLMLTSSAFGLTVLVLIGVGYGIGLVRPYLAPESATAPLVVAFGTGLVATAGSALLAALVGAGTVQTNIAVQAAILVALYNLLLAPPLFAGVRSLAERFPVERSSRWRRG